MKSYFSSQILAKFHPPKKKTLLPTIPSPTHPPFLLLSTQPQSHFFLPTIPPYSPLQPTLPSFFYCSHSFFPWWLKTSLLKGKASTTFSFSFFKQLYANDKLQFKIFKCIFDDDDINILLLLLRVVSFFIYLKFDKWFFLFFSFCKIKGAFFFGIFLCCSNYYNKCYLQVSFFEFFF